MEQVWMVMCGTMFALGVLCGVLTTLSLFVPLVSPDPVAEWYKQRLQESTHTERTRCAGKPVVWHQDETL